MTRDELADLFLVSEFNRYNGVRNWRPEQSTASEYVAHIRRSKPFALDEAYRMADWAIYAAEAIGTAA